MVLEARMLIRNKSGDQGVGVSWSFLANNKMSNATDT